jgi:hypothetical protein
MFSPITRSAALAAAFVAGISPAVAQIPNYPQTMPSDSFVGRITPGPGPSQALPISSLLARVITPNSVPNANLSKAGAATLKGNPTNALGNVQDFTIQGLTARGAPDANNDKLLIFDSASGTFKYVTPGLIAAAATSGVSSLGGATGGISVPAGGLQIVGGQLSSNTLASRAFAITQNLSSFTAITTLGYATPGDGGGATFVNVGAAKFVDQFFGGGYGSYTIQAGGSGYGNGTYSGVPLTGVGSNCMGRVVVSGGAVTAVTIVAPCVSFSVNDILVTPNSFLGGSGSGFQLIVTGVTTPLGSFTDSVGTHFQYFVGAGNFENVRQFGAKMDWHLGNDAIATDDTASLQAAFGFASFNDSHSPGNGGFTGQTVIVPAGGTLFCDNAASGTSNVGLFIPQGVWVKGQGVLSTIMHHCTSLSPGNGNVNPVTLCDTVTAVGQFGCRVTDMMLEDPQTNGFNGTAAIYSNSAQQQTLADNLLIVSKSRGCVKYEIGQGGATNDIWHDIDCEMSSTNTNNGFDLNSSSTHHILTNIVFGCPGGCTGSAIVNRAGRLIATGIDHEEFATGLTQAVSIAGNISSYKNVQGSTSSHCSSAITLTASNTPGNILLENVSTSCLATVTNGQSGGLNFNGIIAKQITYVSGACS